MSEDDGGRAIFRFFDGKCERWADPERVYRRLLLATGGDLAGAVAAAQRQGPRPDPREVSGLDEAMARDAAAQGPPAEGDAPPPDEPGAPAGPVPVEALEAEQRLLDAIRWAYEMPPFDAQTGEGAHDAVCWAAFNAYSSWVEGVKKKPPSSPRSATPTAGSPAGSATSSSSGSGSTPGG